MRGMREFVKYPPFYYLVSLYCTYNAADEAAGALKHAGAISVIKSIPDLLDDAEVEKYKSSLLKRFQDLRYDIPS